MNQRTILVVEDDPNITMGLRDALEFEGFKVVAVANGKDAVLRAKSGIDAVLLDLMLPDMNGYTVCAELRKQRRTLPIIMLTARGLETDKVRGLDAGADDYVTKPFSVSELIARIRALFRRVESHAHSMLGDEITIGQARINFVTQLLTVRGKEEQLSHYELELLKLLLARPNQPVARDEILLKVWGLEGSAQNRTVDNVIVKLRKKVEPNPEQPLHILTVYGFGYKIALDPALA
jgi:DNA-binding response OmpR family regulator